MLFRSVFALAAAHCLTARSLSEKRVARTGLRLLHLLQLLLTVCLVSLWL